MYSQTIRLLFVLVGKEAWCKQLVMAEFRDFYYRASRMISAKMSHNAPPRGICWLLARLSTGDQDGGIQQHVVR